MAERVVSVRLALKNDGFIAGFRQAKQAAGQFTRDLEKGAKKHKADLDELARVSAGVGLAAAAGVGVAVKKFADFDAAMSGVRAATHETVGNMNALREAALKAGADTAFSATEAAAAIENLAKAGVSTKDILGGGLAGALDLAAAGELEVADAAETAATAMTQFKLKGTDVPHIADLLAAAAGKAQGEVSDMAYALNQSGLVAAQMGLSIEETTGTLAAFASAGLLGSDAGTSFKTMLLRLANPAKEAARTMEELGINAYDTQGAFVGIAPLAEQLQKKLGGLSQEQRDAALATIFGSDAIRAANVLYSQGAAGIADWTTKVNDAGFAAETAAIKQDNLRGDIEKLGGSIETALIQVGAGADGILRDLTQGATGAVDAFTKLPGPVKEVGLALGGVVAVGGLSAAGMLKAVTAAGELKEAFTNLGRAGRVLTLSAGAVGVALLAATLIYGAFARKNEEAKQRVEQLKDTLDQQTGAITQNTRSYVANELAQRGLAQKAKDLGLSLSLVTDAALGNQTALRQVNEYLDQYSEANLRASYTNGGVSSSVAKSREAVRTLREELGGMNGSLTEAQKKTKLAAEAARESTGAQDLAKEAVKKANSAYREQKATVDEVIESLHALSNVLLGLRGSEVAYEAAVDAATDAVKDNGRTLDINTEKGRSNRSALDAIARAANDLTDELLKNGRSHTEVAKKGEEARKKFVEVARRMGLNKKAAEELSQKLIDIPNSIQTDITNNAPAAKKKVQDYKAQGLDKLPSKAATNLVVTGGPTALATVRNFATNVEKSLREIKDEAIKVNLGYVSSLGQNPQMSRMNRAEGGSVHGPGTGTSDSIPAMLSNGEHVWTAREVQAAGGHGAVEKMRASALRGYATGGPVYARLGAVVPPNSVIEGVAGQVMRQVRKDLASELEGGPSGPPGQVLTFRGVRLNQRTIAMLMAAERRLGRQFAIMQGSYSTRVAASGSTHAGGGAMDVNGPGGWGSAVAALRAAGFAAWHRTPAQGPWGHHIHALAKGDSSLSAAAKAQVADFLRGGDGLAGYAKGGRVLSFDQGGYLPLGTSLVHNGTGRPEPVGHDFLRKGDLKNIRVVVDLPGVASLVGTMRGIAADEVSASNDFAATAGRMQ